MDDGGRRRLTRLVGRRGPLRSFALGGIVGAAGAIATVRRLHSAAPGSPTGLAAFEDAPCFLELVAQDLAAHGETGATMGDVRSNAE